MIPRNPRLVSLGCSLSANLNITDLLQMTHPKILTQSDPSPVDLNVADIQWQIAAEWLEMKITVKGLDTWCSAAYTRRFLSSSALQSWKWQLIGMG